MTKHKILLGSYSMLFGPSYRVIILINIAETDATTLRAKYRILFLVTLPIEVVNTV